MKYFIHSIKNMNISGRASRREFWSFLLLYPIFLIILLLIFHKVYISTGLFEHFHDIGTLPIVVSFVPKIYMFILSAPLLTLCVRRLHDINRSGWLAFAWCILMFVRIITIWTILDYFCLILNVIFFRFCIEKGTAGDNNFGPEPKYNFKIKQKAHLNRILASLLGFLEKAVNINLSGQASRKEFWQFILFSIIFSFVLYIILYIVHILTSGSITSELNFGIFALIYLIASEILSVFDRIYFAVLSVPLFALCVRRLRDINRNIWLVFIWFVPLFIRFFALWEFSASWVALDCLCVIITIIFLGILTEKKKRLQ